MVGGGVTLVGSALMVAALIRMGDLGLLQPKRSADPGNRRIPPRLRQYRKLSDQRPADPEAIPALRQLARSSVASRWSLLLNLGMAVAASGGAVSHHHSLLWIQLTGCFLVLTAGSSLATEIQARAGASFLRRYPETVWPSAA